VVAQHNDFRLGNVLFDDGGVATAVLDWEFAGAGDPFSDIAYAAQPYCLGRLLERESPLGLADDPTTWLLDQYSQHSPISVDVDRMRFFVAFGIYKMAVALAVPASTWPDGGGGKRDAWLEVPILSLTRDLIAGIQAL
jgi:aminoglycoside phosphotransferase (APT) family kinase protein